MPLFGAPLTSGRFEVTSLAQVVEVTRRGLLTAALLLVSRVYVMGTVPIVGLSRGIRLSDPINGAKYFTWAEATRNGERMPVSSVITANIIRAAKRFDGAREVLGQPMVITSWYRTPEANKAAGGVSNSNHLTGTAIDFYCPSLDPVDVYQKLDTFWQGGLGLYSSHCHLDIGDFSRF